MAKKSLIALLTSRVVKMCLIFIFDQELGLQTDFQSTCFLLVQLPQEVCRQALVPASQDQTTNHSRLRVGSLLGLKSL